jgi:hypothetical protein
MSNPSLMQANFLNKSANDATNSYMHELSNIKLPLQISDLENDLRKREEYYRSNPLRNFAPTKGQTILPHPLNSSRQRKMRLPSAYKELRNQNQDSSQINALNNSNSICNNNNNNNSNSNIRINSSPENMTHKYRLKADLKVNLFYTDDTTKKNLIDLRENSKKVYNEYCHKNITKPVNIKKVQSMIKSIASVNNSTMNTTNNDSISQHESTNYYLPPVQHQPPVSLINTLPNISAPPHTAVNHTQTVLNNSNNKTSLNNTVNSDTNKDIPFIEVKRVNISTLEDMVEEIKHKNKLKNPKIIYDNYDNQNLKYTYKEYPVKINEYLDLSQNTFINQTDSFLNNVNYEIDELELMPSVMKSNMGNMYKRLTKKTPGITENEETNNTNENNNTEEETNNLLKLRKQNQSHPQHKTVPSSAYYPSVLSHLATSHSLIKQEDLNNLTDESIINDFSNRKDVFLSSVFSRQSKQQARMQQAREKIENHSEKANLNKLTVIQPFEDTKILINLNQIPPKALNTIFNFNSDQQQPSYFIPPVKAFGFYTSKTSDNSYNVMANPPPSTPPPAPPTTSTKSRGPRSSHSKKSFASENSTKDKVDNINNKPQTANNQKNSNKDNDSTATYVTPRFFNKEFHVKTKFPRFPKSNSTNVIYTQ